MSGLRVLHGTDPELHGAGLPERTADAEAAWLNG
jgi:hypothetical protein